MLWPVDKSAASIPGGRRWRLGGGEWGDRVGQVQQPASASATSDGFLNVTHTRAEKSTQTNKSLKAEKRLLIDLFWQTQFFFLSAAVEALKPGDTLLNI